MDEPTLTTYVSFENDLEAYVSSLATDAAHDVNHIRRVVANAKKICHAEQANAEVVIPAAWLHDCVAVPKSSPDRARASEFSADHAIDWLRQKGYATNWHSEIHHAIMAHSYSANLACETREAEVVQDADRIDALGAIGLARCFIIGGQLSANIYNGDDPFCESRSPDDKRFILDHFYQKLLQLPATMKTDAGKAEATQRAQYLQGFLDQLRAEITV